jgi:hypothetical protein
LLKSGAYTALKGRMEEYRSMLYPLIREARVLAVSLVTTPNMLPMWLDVVIFSETRTLTDFFYI